MLLVMLLGVSAYADFLARARMDLASRQFAAMNDRTVQDMKVIDFIHAHLWIAIAYVAVFLFCLSWLELRSGPRWIVWITFFVLALPVLAYDSVCLRIGNKFILLTTTVS